MDLDNKELVQRFHCGDCGYTWYRGGNEEDRFQNGSACPQCEGNKIETETYKR